MVFFYGKSNNIVFSERKECGTSSSVTGTAAAQILICRFRGCIVSKKTENIF